MQPHNKKLIFFLLIYLLLSVSTIGYTPVFESTEARYAEIAREMLEKGNYIEPYFNGIKHFHKPPFTYWMIAAGLKLFGINNFGARFFGIIASLFIMIFTFKLSKFFTNEDEREYSVYILGTSVLFLSISRIVATDIYLTLWTVIVQYYYFKQIYGIKSEINAILIGIFLGLGFLTKGPIIFLFTLLPFLVMKIFDEKFRNVFNFKSILLSFVSFLVVSLPWYITVIIKNPGLLEYFLKVQTVDRVTTNRFNRQQPFYFFLNTLFFSTLPYSILIIFKTKQIYKNYKEHLVFLIYIFVPFIIFSIAKSKLHSYLAPFTPLLSIFIFRLYKEYFSEKFNKGILLFISILPIIFIIATFMIDKLKFNPFIILLSLITLAFYVLSYKKSDSIEFIYYLSLATVVIFSIFYFSGGIMQDKLKCYENMIKIANLIDPERKLETLCYGGDLPSSSFYRNKISTSAFGSIRETQFEKDNTFKKYYIQSEEEIMDFLKNNKKFFLITKTDPIEFQKKYRFICTKKYKQRDYYLSLCTQSID